MVFKLFSNSCRLKCDRIYPCNNCKKRGDTVGCTFVGRGPRGKPQHGQSSPTLVQDRLQHLENLVMSLAQKQKQTPDQGPDQVSDQVPDFNSEPQIVDANGPSYQTPSSMSGHDTRSPHDTGTLVVNDEGTSYFESANWRAILKEVGHDSSSYHLYLLLPCD